MPQSINLWSVMNSIKTRDFPASEDALAVVELADKSHGFGTELSLTVDEYGNWKVEIFSHYDSNQRVELNVGKHGDIRVSRQRETNGITELRQISF